MSAGSLLTSALALASVPLTIRMIGLEGYGALVIGQALAAVMSAALVPPAWEIIQKFGAVERGPVESLPAVFRRWRVLEYGLSILALGASIGLIVLASEGLGINDNVGIALVGAASLIVANTSSHIGFLRAKNLFAPTVLAPVIAQCSRLVILVLGWLSEGDQLLVVLMAYAGAELIRVGYLEHVTLAKAARAGPSPGSATEEIRFAAVLCITRVVDTPVQHLDKVAAGMLLGTVDAGYLAVIRRVVGVFGLVADPVRHSVSPVLYKLVARRDIASATSLAVGLGWRIFLVCALLLFPVLIFQDSLLGFITGSAWPPSARMTFVLVMLATIFGLVFISTHTFCYALHRQRGVFFVTIASNVAFMMVLAMAVTSLGLIGFGLAIAVQIFLNILGKLYLLRDLAFQRTTRPLP
ncbi:MAG: lipopolysaccharide biosynthesis protein [Gammaproteobacteria bacterium]